MSIKWLCILSVVFVATASSNRSNAAGSRVGGTPATAPQVVPIPPAELPSLPPFLPKIDRQPSAADFGRGALDSLPAYDPSSQRQWQVDVRGCDLTGLDLRNSTHDLLFADFDSGTRWPSTDRMPTDYSWSHIMELGKDPGLGVRQLHALGITGRGVGIAIIDQPLMVDHAEYRDQLRLYEEINVLPGTGAQMHGSAVASIAVGRTTGVAPEADLYYICAPPGDWGAGPGGFTFNFAYYAQAVRRVLELSTLLPAARKIRVISIQVGWDPSQKGYGDIMAAVGEAKAAGLLVVSSSLKDTFGFRFQGLGRQPLADPNRSESYGPGMFWSAAYRKSMNRGRFLTGRLLVPMDSRTTASPCGPDEYVFYRQGGWSWSIPYIAGLYALVAQVRPPITPDEFWTAALDTADRTDLSHKWIAIWFGKIVDPPALISRLRKP